MPTRAANRCPKIKFAQHTASRNAGFTLLELLIVIVIIGVLALLILPSITSAPKKANDSKRITDIQAIRKALQEYYLDYNQYPATAGVADSVLTPSLTSGDSPYIKTIPVDPKKGIPAQYVYMYTPSNNNTAFTLTACLENTAATGEDIVSPVAPCTTKTFEVTEAN